MGAAKQSLRIFNTNQLQPRAMKGLRGRECKHITASRKNPDTDLQGYIVKIADPRDPKGPLIVKACEKCAAEVADITVARIPFGLLSQKTTVERIMNPVPGQKFAPNSKRGKELFKNVREATAAVQMIDKHYLTGKKKKGK